MEKHKIFCDGGIGNRFASLFMACYIEKMFKSGVEVSWPVNNWCGAELEALFESSLSWDDKSLADFADCGSKYYFFMHENQLDWYDRFVYDQQSIANDKTLGDILRLDRPIFYYANRLPVFLTPNELKSCREILQINAEILSVVNDFSERHNINKTVIGLHVRKTDFGQKVNENFLVDLVRSNPKQKYFVCTDELSVTNKFSIFSNCIQYEKSDYPTRLNEFSGWNSGTVDNIGRNFNFNITRSRQATINGLIDLCLLSKTNMVTTSSSSFLSLAMLFDQAQFLGR
jgi:hypothetical protein